MSGSYTALAVGVNSLTGGAITNALGFGPSGQVGGGTGSGAQAAADPFAPYRANLASLYAGYLQPTKAPGSTGSVTDAGQIATGEGGGGGMFGGMIAPMVSSAVASAGGGTSYSPTDITAMPGYSQFKTGVMDPALEASKRSASASGMMRSGNEQIALEQTAQKGYYGFMTDYLNRLAQGSGATNNPATAVGMGINQDNLNNQAFMQGLGAVATGLKGIYNNSNNTTYDTSMSSWTPEQLNTYNAAPSNAEVTIPMQPGGGY